MHLIDGTDTVVSALHTMDLYILIIQASAPWSLREAFPDPST